MNAYGGVSVYIYVFLTLLEVEGSDEFHTPSTLLPGENSTSTH
jgi:hypothetical protein